MRKRGIVLIGLLVAIPFIGKPLHIDEESYLFIGKAIQGHLSSPYSWWRPWQPSFTPQPDSLLYAHPPLHLWLMSLLEPLSLGGSILALRLLMLPWVLLLVAALARLVTLFVKDTSSRTLVTLGLVFSPTVLLVLHQSLMLDLPFAALALMGLAVLAQAQLEARVGPLWLAGLLLGLASLTKYPALLLLPLAGLPLAGLPAIGLPLAMRTPTRHAATSVTQEPIQQSPWLRLVSPALLLPLCLLLGWQLYTTWRYGTPHLWAVLSHAPDIARSPLSSRLLGNLAQLGFSAVGLPLALLTLLPARGRFTRIGVAISGAFIGLFVCVRALEPEHLSASSWLAGLSDELVGHVPTSTLGLASLGLAFALGILALSNLSLRTRSDRWLSAWALFTLLGVWLGHNFAGARYLMLAAPPLHLLLWRRLERSGNRVSFPAVPLAVGLACVVGLSVAYADYRSARVYPLLAAQIDEILEDRANQDRVYFSGEWGFRAALEARGFQYLTPETVLQPGDWVIAAEVAAPGDLSRLEHVPPRSELIQDEPPGLRVLSPREGIGFYSEVIGLLPFGYGEQPLERARIWRITH